MSLQWTDKVDNKDDVLAKDINGIAHSVIDLETQVENSNNQIDKKIDSTAFADNFVYETVYNTGDIVLWESEFYRCRSDNTSGVIPNMPGFNKWEKFPDNFMNELFSVSSKAGIDSICMRWMPFTSYNIGDIVYDNTDLNTYKLIKANPSTEPETGYPHLNTEYWATTTIANYVDYKIGNIETALNGIISLQNSYIGGEE